MSAELAASEKPIVWFEGELDERYFKCAAQLLGFNDLIDSFHWIGALETRAVLSIRVTPHLTMR